MTILIVREETRCHHMGYSFRLAEIAMLHAPSHRQHSNSHGLVTSFVDNWLEQGIVDWVHHEGSIRRPIAPRANALTTQLKKKKKKKK